MQIEFATVTWSINLTNIEVPDGASAEQQQEIIQRLAESRFPGGLEDPIISDSSNSDLID